jgi:hypothetical protein
MRNDAGAVEAEENGVGGLRENLAVEIAADQEDGHLFSDAAQVAMKKGHPPQRCPPRKEGKRERATAATTRRRPRRSRRWRRR